MGLVDEDGPVGLLVHEHRRLVAAETGAREPEIAYHPKGLLPDARTSAGTDGECFLDTREQRLHVDICGDDGGERQDGEKAEDAGLRRVSRPRASHAPPTSDTPKAMRPERDVETTSARVITTPATPTHTVLVPIHSSSATSFARRVGDGLRALSAAATYPAASGHAISTHVAK